jgi:hypothetical protein
MATLNDFIASIKTEGLMRSSRFAVSFNLPAGISRYSAHDSNLSKILLYCDNIALPSVTVETTAAKTFGEYREMPYNRLFDNISMGFYVDNSMGVKKFFDDWVNTIQNPYTRTFGYYREYTTDITIDVLDIQDKNRYQVKLFECYPKSINAIQMDYSNKDVMKLSVNMNVKYWLSTARQSSNPLESQLRQDLAISEFVGDSSEIPDTYFTNFNQYQVGYNSFEERRNNLYTSQGSGDF